MPGDGVICGSREFAESVRRVLAGHEASAPSAPVIAAAVKAMEIAGTDLNRARASLFANAMRLRLGISQLGLELPAGSAPFFGLPIGTAANMGRIHHELLAAGLHVPVIPAPGIGAVLRFSVTAHHTHAMIDALLCALCVVL